MSYATTQLHPIMFQDDTIRLTSSIEAAQKGNTIMNSAMKRKQLELNADKCCVIVFDRKSKAKSTREIINNNSLLSIGHQMIKAKEKDKYLGDILHEGGLGKSVEATISDRYGKTFAAIIEIGSVINYFRIDAIGGLKAGLGIFELCVILSLLNNSDMWVEIESASTKRLEDMQNMMFKNLFAVPHSVPTPSLRSDLGCLAMDERIDKRKLNLLFHLRNLETSALANEIYEMQKFYNFPGLVSECRKLIIKYRLPNIIDMDIQMTKLQWKNLVKKAIINYSSENLKLQFKTYSKLKDGPLIEGDLSIEPYVQDMKLRDARTLFRLRTQMLPAKFNMKSSPKFSNESWKCDFCKKIDSQSHIMWCPSFAPLREGRNINDDKDLVDYIQQVFKIREDFENKKA